MAAIALSASACGADDVPTRSTSGSAVSVIAEGCSLISADGAGVVVGSPGIVVTVAHTIAGATRISVVGESGQLLRAEVRWFDPASDIAVLSVDDLGGEGLGVGTVEVGDDVAVLVRRPGEGSASVGASIIRFIAVTIEDIYLEETVHRSGIELQAEIIRGDSGAGVVTADGTLVGIIYARSRVRPGVAFALDAAEIKRALVSAADSVVPHGRCT